MNYLNRLSPIALTLCFFIFFGCNDEVQDNNYKREKSACMAPEAIGVADYITTIDGMDGIKYAWDAVPGALGYEFELSVNDVVTPVATAVLGQVTEYDVVSIFAIDDVVKAKVRTICDKGATSEWVEIESINRNGGATVDDIPSVVDWGYVCNVSTCEYIRFIDDKVEDCEGGVIELGVGYGGKNFYLKSDVCPCLFAAPICETLPEITSCLETPYLKRNYTVCNPQ